MERGREEGTPPVIVWENQWCSRVFLWTRICDILRLQFDERVRWVRTVCEVLCPQPPCFAWG